MIENFIFINQVVNVEAVLIYTGSDVLPYCVHGAFNYHNNRQRLEGFYRFTLDIPV